MSANLAIASRLETTQDIDRSGVGRDRIRNDVSRPHPVPGEERMQLRQRVQILEPLPRPRRRVPLVVPLGIDADEESDGMKSGWHRVSSAIF